MVRSTLAVVVGFVVLAGLVMAAYIILLPEPALTLSPAAFSLTTGFMVRMLVVEFLAGLVAGAVTASLARRAAVHHTLVLVLVVFACAAFLMLTVSGGEPLRFQLGQMGVLAAGVFLGAVFRLRRGPATA